MSKLFLLVPCAIRDVEALTHLQRQWTSFFADTNGRREAQCTLPPNGQEIAGVRCGEGRTQSR